MEPLLKVLPATYNESHPYECPRSNKNSFVCLINVYTSLLTAFTENKQEVRNSHKFAYAHTFHPINTIQKSSTLQHRSRLVNISQT